MADRVEVVMWRDIRGKLHDTEYQADVDNACSLHRVMTILATKNGA